jgi:hypothetical protein
MSVKEKCPSCGIPEEISSLFSWNGDGTITERTDPDHRLTVLEVDGINGLFQRLSDLVGIPIDRFVTEGERKGTLDFLRMLLPGVKGTAVRAFLRGRVYRSFADIGAYMGLGHYELLGFKRGEYLKLAGRNIHSVPLFSGELMAAFNFVERMPASLNIEERGDAKTITVTPGEPSSKELERRMARKTVPRKAGAIAREACPKCGLPIALGNFFWDLTEGKIVDNISGKRVFITGSDAISAVFRELEQELGEEIPHNIVRSYRDYLVAEHPLAEIGDEKEVLMHYLALRGMGNLVSFELSGEGLQAEVENASPPLLVSALLQAVFELSSGKRESRCDYNMADDGDLSVSIKP